MYSYICHTILSCQGSFRDPSVIIVRCYQQPWHCCPTTPASLDQSERATVATRAPIGWQFSCELAPAKALGERQGLMSGRSRWFDHWTYLANYCRCSHKSFFWNRNWSTWIIKAFYQNKQKSIQQIELYLTLYYKVYMISGDSKSPKDRKRGKKHESAQIHSSTSPADTALFFVMWCSDRHFHFDHLQKSQSGMPSSVESFFFSTLLRIVCKNISHLN